MNHDEVTAERIKRWMSRNELQNFSLREVLQAMKGSRGTVKNRSHIVPAINLLITSGWVASPSARTRGIVGRPRSPNFSVLKRLPAEFATSDPS